MTRLKLLAAAAFIAFAPGAAFAQTTLTDPSMPGSGYRIPSTPPAGARPLAGYQVDPGIPGDGYRIAPPQSAQPLAADMAESGMPGDGYRIHSGR